MSPILGLRTTIYKVTDLTAAKERYSKAFEATPYFDEPFYVGYNIAGYELGLQPDETPASAKVESVQTLRGVEDCQKEFDRLVALGATPVEAPTNVGGEIIVASVKDLWGNIVGLIYNPEFTLPQ